MDRPWTEQEKVYLLAEIIKAAPVSSDYLVKIIQEAGFQPRWQEICLPYGRPLYSCQTAFDRLVRQPLPHLMVPGYPVPPPAGPSSRVPPSELSRKRPLAPETSTSNTMGRMIQPRPPLGPFPSVDPLRAPGGYPPSAGSGAPSISGGTGEPTQKKKRGRPTKAEQQARAEAAAARGEVMSRSSRQEPLQAPYPPDVTGRQPPYLEPRGSMTPSLSSPIRYQPTPSAQWSGVPESEADPMPAGRRSQGNAPGERASGVPTEAPSSAGADGSPAKSGQSAFESSQSGGSVYGPPPAQTGLVGPTAPSTYEPGGESLPGAHPEETPSQAQPVKPEPQDSRARPPHPQQPQQSPQPPEPEGQQRTTPHSFKETVGF